MTTAIRECLQFEWGKVISDFFSLFRCQRCGECCKEQNAGVILLSKDVTILKEVVPTKLGMSYSKFKDSFTFTEDGHRKLHSPCVFYDGGCSIYRYRPAVCRMFPLCLTKENKIRVDPDCPGAKIVMNLAKGLVW